VLLAVFAVIYAIIDRIDGRLRNVECQISAISARLGIDPKESKYSEKSGNFQKNIDKAEDFLKVTTFDVR
jgi:hypothetical protein